MKLYETILFFIMTISFILWGIRYFKTFDTIDISIATIFLYLANIQFKYIYKDK